MKLQHILGLWKDTAITVAAAVLVYFVIGFTGGLGRLQAGVPIRVGQHLSLPGEAGKSGLRDLIIVGSNSCYYSRQSIEFDRKLVLTAGSIGLPVHILSPTAAGAAWYSRQLSLSPSSILVHRLNSLGIRGTPTVILRDESGTVQGLWEGLLPVSEQHAVLLRVGEKKHTIEQPHFEDLITYSTSGVESKAASISPAIPQVLAEIDETRLFALGARYTVIDLRERDSLVGEKVKNEVNIPFPELDVRARIELNPQTPIIVDCSTIDVGVCDLAALKLVSLKFASVSVLDRGSRGRACGMTSAFNS